MVYGERCGNTNICSLIPNLQLKRGFEVIGDKISKLYDTARQIAEISNKSLNASMPYVGRSAFAHKAGVHASGVRKTLKLTNILTLLLVGNSRRFLISDQAGSASIKERLDGLKFVQNVSDDDIKK